jgi:hypothetical protein
MLERALVRAGFGRYNPSAENSAEDDNGYSHPCNGDVDGLHVLRDPAGGR